MLIAAITAAATLATHALGQAGSSGIEIRATRFWMPASKQTEVQTTINVSYALVKPVGTGPGAYLSYLVGVKVLDADHKVLYEERWARHAPAAMLAQNASSLEELSFAVPAGSYQVAVDVVDSATGRRVVDSTRVSAFTADPSASDLMVASKIRAVSTDTSTQVGELGRGAYRFTTAPTPHIDATEPTIGFLLEAYSADATTATLALKIASMDGTDLVPLMPAQRSIPAGGGLIGSQFSLEGLPAGAYLLKASVTLHGQTIERQAPFVVNTTPVTVASNVGTSNFGLDESYFRSLPEDSLDAEAEELSLLPDATRSDLAVYKRDELSLDAKRRFMIEFWAKRDPNKATPENEARIQFYRAVDYVNRNYGTRFTAGWKTPRGKVFAAYGAPDDSLASHMAGRGIPYLVWRYTHGKSRWFIFGDRQNNNNYQLMRSTETQFPGTPGWTELVTPESSQDIAIWLGLDKRFFINNP